MDTRQIYNTLRRHPKSRLVFLDCVPADRIPFSGMHPYTVVVNTDVASRPGHHWVAIYAPSPTTVEYFDSYGDPPTDRILDYLQRFDVIRRNTDVLQSLMSSVCGQYCIYFILKRAAGESFDSIVHRLALQNSPDATVRLFYRSLYS